MKCKEHIFGGSKIARLLWFRLLLSRIRALCDKLLLGSGLLGVSGAVSRAAGGEKAVSRAEDRGLNSGGVLGLRLGEGPSVLGLDKLHLLKEVRRAVNLS